MAGAELIISAICNATFCEAVYDNPISDIRLTKKQSDILNLTKEINGKHLRIATYNNYPLSWVEKGDNGTLVGFGVAFAIVDILQERFNFTYDVVVPEQNFEMGGRGPGNSLIGMLNSSQADMAAAFLPKLGKFINMISYSSDLDEGVWKMMLKRPTASAAGSGLMAPFNGLVWYLTLAAVLCYGPCITFLTRLRSRLVKDERHLPLSPSFWFVYSAFIKQGTNLAPEANTTRILFATWWMFIILLSAFYTANLTAFLTLSKFTLDIETPEDLYKKNYRWVSTDGGSVQFIVKNPMEKLYFLNKMVTSGRAEFRNFPNDMDYLPLVDKGAVLVKEVTAIDNLMYGDYLKKAREGVNEVDRCTYVVAPKSFMTKPRAFAFPHDSPLKTLFDTVFVYIVQAGIINYLQLKDLPSTKICPLDLQSKDRQLRNSDLLMTYMIMVTGLCAAAAVFIGEVVFKRYYIKTKLHKEALKPKGRRSKKTSKRLRFEDDGGLPPPYDSLFGNTRYNLNENSKRKIVNGREYYEYTSSTGDTRLIPVRAPSAFLYH
uniref:Ionotropic receptor n=1 Tax=Semiothisa cinerearia TaxID=2249628 RepID=A0A889XLY7_9NEOP|nr:ionotropic receptor [Semiothisa cinerearia]